jgi:gliding motility-associated-like protein
MMDFSLGSPSVFEINDSLNTWESMSSYSDKNGNLLLYTNGYVVKNAQNAILPNGNNIHIANDPSLVGTITQGALVINHPETDSLYYLLSMGVSNSNMIIKTLSYSLIEKNTGNLNVVSKANLLLTDTLAEKMTSAKHCNNRDLWLILVRYCENVLYDGAIVDYSIEFLAFLVTKNGISLEPIRSKIKADCPNFGQMKLNNRGDELAFAGAYYINRFNFDNSTGKVSFKKQHETNLSNGYGFEYSPDDSKLYLLDSQFDIQTETETNLHKYPVFAQLQRGSDNRIYSRHLGGKTLNLSPPNQNQSTYSDNSNLSLSFDPSNYIDHKIGVINFPNLLGTNCMVDSIALPSPTYLSFGMPNFSSFHFNSSPSDFLFIGNCIQENFLFYTEDQTSVYDSIKWYFPHTNQFLYGDSVLFSFDQSGQYEVICYLYKDSVEYFSTQCVQVCGLNDFNLPSKVNLCESNEVEINLVNPCTTSYLWSTGDTTSVFKIKDKGIYTLQYTNACGVFYDTIEVYEAEDCALQTDIPNVFTPNEDGINEQFSISFKNVKSFNYQILNRWGNVIYDGNYSVPVNQMFNWNSFLLWDGYTNNNQKVTPGVYFYNIEFIKTNDTSETKTGFISVIY